MAKRRVVLTGAAGYISGQLLPEFRRRYELTLLDVAKANLADVIEVDLTDPNLEAYRRHFKGADAIVHNAYTWDPRRSGQHEYQWLPPEQDPSPYPASMDGYIDERTNLDMVYRVLRLAVEESIPRVVIASSNHAADWYEGKLHNGLLQSIGPEMLPLSDNFYGWAKQAYEHLGFVFACGRFGRVVETVFLRIGAPRPISGPRVAGDLIGYRRDLGAYISPRDLTQLYLKSVETADICGTVGVPCQIFYGRSNNTRAFWSIANAREVIGYAPEDDSEVLFAADIRRLLIAPAER
ncbi:MAG: NAD(P)-dependent oxidoreductase [Alphaproteobacteria bacterium]|nr:NAD(P)-dependent oxidoreductase [Alphaproteobacteria bacterium]